MNRVVLTGLALTIASLSDLPEAQSRSLSLEATEHGWRANYAEARDEARRTNRPLMIVFRCVP